MKWVKYLTLLPLTISENSLDNTCVCLLKMASAQVFSCRFCEIFRNTLINIEHIWTVPEYCRTIFWDFTDKWIVVLGGVKTDCNFEFPSANWANIDHLPLTEAVTPLDWNLLTPSGATPQNGQILEQSVSNSRWIVWVYVSTVGT